MISFLLRWAGFAVALLAGLMAWGSWQTGSPPPWSLFGERADARIVESRVESWRIGNGTTRHGPVVMVDRGRGAERLGGLTPAFFDFRAKGAEAIVSGYRPGETATVRMVDRQLLADRQDLFQTAHAIFLSLMTLVVAAIGVIMFLAFGSDRKPRA